MTLRLFPQHLSTWRATYALLLASPWAFAESENVSFYGKRGVVIEKEEQRQAVEFHRRAIAPPITEELDIEPTQNDDRESVTIQTYALSRNEQLLAKKAQYYFDKNWRSQTGLWDSVRGYPHATMWDIASGIAATLALEALDMKSEEKTLYELTKTLDSLKKMPLYNNQLPNREYSTKTALPSGLLSQTSSNGNGWSALDIGRLLIWLNILQESHPSLSPTINQIIDKWQLKRAVHKDTLYGAKLYKGREYYRQEGRHGYLQYASKGFQLFGFDIDSTKTDVHLDSIKIDGISLRKDKRNVPFFTSDPYILSALEYGENKDWNQLDSIYQLHKNVWENDQQLVSFGEDAMDKNPWFAYNNIYYYNKPWTSVSSGGKPIENPQQFSHKIAYGFSVLFNDSFSESLAQNVLDKNLSFRSISTGIYEDGGSNIAFNINTNSLVLVALWYKTANKQPILSAITESDETSN
ncbi:DUF3131 domain-containing protein [Vibrio makurazakiensis]|uniref:DUF3131 domain-containing protein n=1 Tax=Vibrio makurazakiensis TaxID=2910250 RepID=UPI003D0E789C